MTQFRYAPLTPRTGRTWKPFLKVRAGHILYAKDNGAKYVEAYPVDPESPSYRFMENYPMKIIVAR